MSNSPEQPTFDEIHIESGLALAEMQAQPIDHWPAARIASQFHSGQASPLYSFASSGNVDTAGIFRELMHTEAEPGRTEQDKRWLHALGTYVVFHDGQERIPDWYQLVKDSSAPFLGRIATWVKPIPESDYIGYYNIPVGPDTEPEDIQRIKFGIEEFGGPYAWWVKANGLYHLDYSEATFEEAYIGCYDTAADAPAGSLIVTADDCVYAFRSDI